MNRRSLVLGLSVSLIAAGAVAATWVLVSGSRSATLGQRLYAEYCASCHGVALEGQPDWQTRLATGRLPAPPHDETGHTWHHADQDLFTIVEGGLAAVVPGYESDMPAFGEILSDAEIWAVLSFIKGTWPDRQRDYQAARTREWQPR